MDIKAKLVRAFDSGKIRGIFDVTLDNAFVIRGVKLISGEKGEFVSMPSTPWKNKNGETQYTDVVYPLDSTARGALYLAVSNAYYDNKRSVVNNNAMDELPFGW